MDYKDILKLAEKYIAAGEYDRHHHDAHEFVPPNKGPETLEDFVIRVANLLRQTGVRALSRADSLRWRQEKPAIMQWLKKLSAPKSGPPLSTDAFDQAYKEAIMLIQSRLG